MYLNETKLIGHVGRDPEIRVLANGDPVANFSLATTKRYKNDTGEVKDITDWHNLVAFRNLAKVVEDYVKSGQPLYVCGESHTRKWTDDKGVERYTTEITLNDIQFLNRRQDKES